MTDQTTEVQTIVPAPMQSLTDFCIQHKLTATVKFTSHSYEQREEGRQLLYRFFYRANLFLDNAPKPWYTIKSYVAFDTVMVPPVDKTVLPSRGWDWREVADARKILVEAAMFTPDQIAVKAEEHKPNLNEVLMNSDILDAPAEYSEALAVAQQEHGAVTELLIFDAWRDLNPETNDQIGHFQYAAELYQMWVKLLGLAEAERLLFNVEKDY